MLRALIRRLYRPYQQTQLSTETLLTPGTVNLVESVDMGGEKLAALQRCLYTRGHY